MTREQLMDEIENHTGPLQDVVMPVIDAIDKYAEEIRTAPHLCPVCDGKGLVPNGFYEITTEAWTTGNIKEGETGEKCRTCGGLGIVWKGDQ